MLLGRVYAVFVVVIDTLSAAECGASDECG
jgi:hypothetical protein